MIILRLCFIVGVCWRLLIDDDAETLMMIIVELSFDYCFWNFDLLVCCFWNFVLLNVLSWQACWLLLFGYAGFDLFWLLGSVLVSGDCFCWFSKSCSCYAGFDCLFCELVHRVTVVVVWTAIRFCGFCECLCCWPLSPFFHWFNRLGVIC